ncbi:squalene--hopene cyclase [Massilia horti]|uniref:Squalene--hopene cyclase n=1 Tax=Massilia horti TaxID=2562153 RepID=A0A4Y9SYS0_9BURK|nr:squalene--hopene cyclase [Massilia horti]TFW31602.1 squalene--hopene cyclase [Massilia horti]TFW31605.1 squalene--hopene cyclase [Massilia horti]
MGHSNFSCLPNAPADLPPSLVEEAIGRAMDAVLAEQRPDGHWVYELEADATIPAEYVLMVHYLGEPADLLLEAGIGRYLRRIQGQDGGWPLFHGGALDVSASVKAYFALKMIGDAPHAPHMARARAAILAHGGAECSNVFTRLLLALFGQVPWCAVPHMPAEIALLPYWSPFHLSKVSYWTRTVVMPLLVLTTLKPRAKNPRGVRIDELFIEAPGRLGMATKAPHQSAAWFALFRSLDAHLRTFDKRTPRSLRRRAIERAASFVRERLNGEDGLGAIFPAMVNAVQMLDALGVPRDSQEAMTARRAIDKLLVRRLDECYCQPCLSPVWDTALMCHALLECGQPAALEATCRALNWLKPLQVLDIRGDWCVRRPTLRPGGWAFQYANPHYPDVDDTAVVAMAMHRAGMLAPMLDFGDALARATEWVVGMQGRGGGWGAFEPENTHLYLNNIPFSDHGALLDPPTADVSARCLSMLAQLQGKPGKHSPAARALGYLLREQEKDGSWYGRWGMNYIYGTWSALCALNAAGVAHDAAPVSRACAWLAGVQNLDGGWGEDGTSYRLGYDGYEPAASTPSQTAWALLGLMAAGATGHPAVARGIRWLVERQRPDGLWDEAHYTATGFPRVFYLRYHGYARYFPLWALARYRNLRGQGSRRVAFGM